MKEINKTLITIAITLCSVIGFSQNTVKQLSDGIEKDQYGIVEVRLNMEDEFRTLEGRENEVSIPGFFYKVILDNYNHRGIGFVMPNGNCNYPIMSYAISIDSVETLTGINFFSKIKDED